VASCPKQREAKAQRGDSSCPARWGLASIGPWAAWPWGASCEFGELKAGLDSVRLGSPVQEGTGNMATAARALDREGEPGDPSGQAQCRVLGVQ
jgi:hypothetical protein